MSAPLVIDFPNKAARKHFMQWLNSSNGEGSYEIWMDAREYEDKTPEITILSKKMDYKNGVILLTCGRLDAS